MKIGGRCLCSSLIKSTFELSASSKPKGDAPSYIEAAIKDAEKCCDRIAGTHARFSSFKRLGRLVVFVKHEAKVSDLFLFPPELAILSDRRSNNFFVVTQDVVGNSLT